MNSAIKLIKIDRRSITKVSQQIEQSVESLIYEQKFHFDELLPNSEELATLLRIDHNEVNEAYLHLFNKGLLREDLKKYRVKYNSLANNYFDQFIGVYDAIARLGFTPHVEVIEKKIVSFSKDVLSTMGFKENEKLFQLSRVYFANDNPVTVIISYFPTSIFPGIENLNFGSGPCAPTIEQAYNTHIDSYHHQIKSENVPSIIASLLKVRTNRALFKFTARGYDKEKHLLEFNYTWLCSPVYFSFVSDKKAK